MVVRNLVGDPRSPLGKIFGDLIERVRFAKTLLVMRPVIFASLGLALGTASLSSYAACTTRDEYDQTINQLQANYSGAVDVANKQYADKTARMITRRSGFGLLLRAIPVRSRISPAAG